MPSFRRSVEPVLGTRLTMRVDAAGEPTACNAFEAALAEADRLEQLLSAFRPASAFVLWRRGELADPGPEVVAVLDLAARWFDRTQGAFSPLLGVLMRRWARAEHDDHVPGRAEMAELAAAVPELPYRVDGEQIHVLGDCGGVDVHGIAKGWVIDQMVSAALGITGVVGVLVDLGGDMRHARSDAASDVRVAIEDPFVAADNASPLTVVQFADRAIATSGGARRGWTVAGRWFGHLLDPRSGWPLAARRSATAFARSAADADALASAASVLGPGIADIEPGCVALVADEGRQVWRSPRWRATVAEL